VLPRATTPGRINRLASIVICFPVVSGSTYVCAILDQTDVGVSGALHTGLGFFGPPLAEAPDPPCGEVCPVLGPGGLAAFTCSATLTMDDLGPPFTPTSAPFASGHQRGPEPDCVPFGPSLETVSCGSLSVTMLAGVQLFLTMSSDSSAAPDETTGLATLSGRLQTRRRCASCACFRRIPVAKHRADSGTFLRRQCLLQLHCFSYFFISRL
jgi:hypothetical protein